MIYKGKKVSRHRYRQLTVTQKNHYLDTLLYALYPRWIKNNSMRRRKNVC